MDDRSESVDVVTLVAALRDGGLLEDVGGADFIYYLAESCPAAANAPQYARIICEAARRRVGVALAQRLEMAFAEGTRHEQEQLARDLVAHFGICVSCGRHGQDERPGACCLAHQPTGPLGPAS